MSITGENAETGGGLSDVGRTYDYGVQRVSAILERIQEQSIELYYIVEGFEQKSRGSRNDCAQYVEITGSQRPIRHSRSRWLT